ncbi:hypothetical protein [Actibacterium sp. MT2.3-13A]|uniref:hypothetical protein n=1 Tax=Actibacterium sp. MT2.3-13A TaxID=2828332 RepID=UPI001BAE25AF|nr:hypothetical protein [Actibacterium sp. MT2.3-13A]
MAATAAEARFRVQYPNSKARVSRVFALDQHAAEAMYAITEAPWNGAHFLTVTTRGDVVPDETGIDDLPLSTPDGSPALLSEELQGANVVILLSSQHSNAGAAEVIAREAYHRNIMTVGLTLGQGASDERVNAVVNTLRPFTSVLVVASDNDYVPAMLSALRA